MCACLYVHAHSPHPLPQLFCVYNFIYRVPFSLSISSPTTSTHSLPRLTSSHIHSQHPLLPTPHLTPHHHVPLHTSTPTTSLCTVGWSLWRSVGRSVRWSLWRSVGRSVRWSLWRSVGWSLWRSVGGPYGGV